ncbi:MAG: hypothetical protein SF028_07595 [Candidatus Sumerlaeia bacterium]|nr:hypothetical protein [Candidatus Sumerlaeia bacterium]
MTLSRGGRDVARAVPGGSPGKSPTVADKRVFGISAQGAHWT